MSGAFDFTTSQGLPIKNGQIVLELPIVFEGGQIIGKSATPPTLLANTDNYNPNGLTDQVTAEVIDYDLIGLIRIQSSGNIDFTGLQEPTAFGDNPRTRLIYLRNIGGNNIILKNQDGDSLANNRFDIGGNKTVQGGEGVLLIYDDVDLRWASAGITI